MKNSKIAQVQASMYDNTCKLSVLIKAIPYGGEMTEEEANGVIEILDDCIEELNALADDLASLAMPVDAQKIMNVVSQDTGNMVKFPGNGNPVKAV